MCISRLTAYVLPLWWLVSCVWVAPVSVSGQLDSTHMLHEVEVTALRIDLTDIGKHTDKLDSQLMQRTYSPHLASLLSRQTPLFVRSYGNGTLATLGIRGGSASHTQLLWNGIPLRNPMIGLIDLALIPSTFVDHASVHYGGHGAAFGSGAVGGLIAFGSNPVADVNRIEVSLAAGSWLQGFGAVRVQYGDNHLRWSTRLFTQTAENNYRYKLNRDLPERNQTHHRLDNMGLMQEGVLSLSEHQKLIGRFWYQYSNRQIPPTSVQTYSQAAQQDESIRASLHWSMDGKKTDWQIKAAWLDERIHFQDSLILLFTENQFQTIIAEAEMVISLGQGFQMANGLYAERAAAMAENYESAPVRHQYAGFTSLRLLKENWLWRVQAREEITDGAWAPLLIDLSTEFFGLKQLSIKASLSRNYRTPTLNDLYWMPGGNSDLLPERGWTLESGVTHSMLQDHLHITSSATGYVRTIDQWIMWMPPVKGVQNYWAPINVAQVHSQGLEIRNNTTLKGIDWSGSLRFGLDLTWSTFGTDLPDFSVQQGDQLFYIPVTNVMAGFEVEKGPWAIFYTHHWFGTSPGINEEVKAANVGSAGMSTDTKPARSQVSFFLQMDNIWNVPYRIIERRPMPGRTISGGLKLSFS